MALLALIKQNYKYPYNELIFTRELVQPSNGLLTESFHSIRIQSFIGKFYLQSLPDSHLDPWTFQSAQCPKVA